MKKLLTNAFNAPDVFYQAALENIQQPSKDELRVSEIKSPPLIRKLKLAHWDNIQTDVIEHLLAMFGTGMHTLFERISPKEKGKRLKAEFQGQVISGEPDRMLPNQIDDYKVTHGIAGQAKLDDYASQLNLYVWLRKKALNEDTMLLNIHEFDRMWMQMVAYQQQNTPQSPIRTYAIRVWPFDETEFYLQQRIALHNKPGLNECSLDDKWASNTVSENGEKITVYGTIYSLIGKTAKKATKRFRTFAQAENYILEKGWSTSKYNIVPVEAIPIRCILYCEARSVCPFAPDNVVLYGGRENVKPKRINSEAMA